MTKRIPKEMLENVDFTDRGMKEFATSTERATIEIFLKDADYAQILAYFGRTMLEYMNDVKRETKPVVPNRTMKEMFEAREKRKKQEKKERLDEICTGLMAMLKTLETADIIRIIPKHERQAKKIWKKLKLELVTK